MDYSLLARRPESLARYLRSMARYLESGEPSHSRVSSTLLSVLAGMGDSELFQACLQNLRRAMPQVEESPDGMSPLVDISDTRAWSLVLEGESDLALVAWDGSKETELYKPAPGQLWDERKAAAILEHAIREAQTT